MKRSKTSKAWLREHINDVYVKRAKQEGFRSRAAFKLLEIDQRNRLLAPGMTVVDLGAAPGSWAQVVSQKIAPGGMLIALDILEMAPLPGVTMVQGDFREEATLSALQEILQGRAVDLVISDMAPNVTGIDLMDQARSMHLCELALDFALQCLKPGGCFLVKLFQGSGFEDFLRAMRQHFGQVVTRKPQASRGRSNEIYLLGKGLRK